MNRFGVVFHQSQVLGLLAINFFQLQWPKKGTEERRRRSRECAEEEEGEEEGEEEQEEEEEEEEKEEVEEQNLIHDIRQNSDRG